MYWTGETWFQVARPEKFKCPKTGKECTWVLGRKTEIRKNTQRPKDVHPEVWGHMMSEKARAEHLHKWLTETKPSIERAEAARDHNGLKLLRQDDDLQELLMHDASMAAVMKVEGILTADNLLIKIEPEKTENDTGLPDANELDYDSGSSEHHEKATSKCLACRKKIWKPEFESLSNASQKKKDCCTWNSKDAPKIDPRSKEVARMP